MRMWRTAVMGVFIIGLWGCAAVSVRTDYDRSVDFRKFKAYNWDSEQQVPGDVLARDPLLRKRIKTAVDEVLQSRGFELRPSGNADFTVMIHAGVKERMRITDWGNYGWYDPWWGPYGGRLDVSYYTEGTLVIDLFDAATRELAWRGMGEGIVREYTDAKRMEEEVRNTVTEILEHFPPRDGSSSRKK